MARSRKKVETADERRTKPRVAIVMSPELRREAERMAAERRRSLSAFLEDLVAAEVERERRRKA